MHEDFNDPLKLMDRMERTMLGNFGIADSRFRNSPLDDFFRQVERFDNVFGDHQAENQPSFGGQPSYPQNQEERFSRKGTSQFKRQNNNQGTQNSKLVVNIYDV